MQKDGLEAIGVLVERDFGEDGVYVGTVVGFRVEKGGIGYIVLNIVTGTWRTCIRKNIISRMLRG